MLTKDEQSQLAQLRRLEKKSGELEMLYDRFGRSELLDQIKHMAQQIDAIPEAVRVYARREDELKRLILLVERHLLNQTAKFQPTPSDLPAAIRALRDDSLNIMARSNKDSLPRCIETLKELNASDEEIDIAIWLAQDLNESRLQLVKYVKTLKDRVRDYLMVQAKRAEDSRPQGLMAVLNTQPPDPLPDVTALWRDWLREAVHDHAGYHLWDDTKAARTPQEQNERYRYRIIISLATLRGLGLDETRLDEILFEAQRDWYANRDKPKK